MTEIFKFVIFLAITTPLNILLFSLVKSKLLWIPEKLTLHDWLWLNIWFFGGYFILCFFIPFTHGLFGGAND